MTITDAGATTASASADSTVKKVKRRRKPIKSCAFCRQRKLKCDQRKPVCSSCKARNFYNCIYPVLNSLAPEQTPNHTEMVAHSNNVNESNHILSPLQSGSMDTNELLLKVQFLEQQISEMKNKSSPIASNEQEIVENRSQNSPITNNNNNNNNTFNFNYNRDESVFQNFDQHLPNPLNDYYFLQCKTSGRRIVYGPTSMRTNLHKHWSGFGHKFNQLWAKIKFERNKWKKSRNISNSTELKYIEQPNDTQFTTLLEKLCHDLPPYNKCLEIIKNFFDLSYDHLCLVNSALDRYKVINDFYTYFIPDSDNLLPNGDKPIKNLLAGSKKNYYKVAVIVQIIALRYFYQNCPESIDLFFLYLLGQISAKVFFIERLQFMLLRCYYLKIYTSDCDSSNVINIVGDMVVTAVTMGLDRDINTIYKDQEHVLGNLKSVRNLWKMIIFLDLECSFQTGRPLLLHDIDLDYLNYNDIVCDDPHLTKIMRMTKMGRRILMSLNSKRGTPKFQSLVEHIIDFMERELPPISLFVNSEKLAQVSFSDVRVVSFCLELILCLNALNSAVNKSICAENRHKVIHISLIAFHMLQAVTDRCFQLDKEQFPEMFSQASSNLTPYFSQAIWFAAGLLPSVSTIFCSILYYRLTVFINNDFLFYNQQHITWNPNTLRISDKGISILDAFDIYNKLTDKWLYPDNPLKKQIMDNSYFFMVTNALQLTFRKVLLKCIEYRKITEDAWLSQLNDSIQSNPDSYLNDSKRKNLQEMLDENLIRNESIAKGVCPISKIMNAQQIQMKTDENNCPKNLETCRSINNSVDFFKKDSKKIRNDFTTYSGPVSPNYSDDGKDMTHNIEDNNKKLISEKESAMLQQITDEFWSNYNTGWEELLNQTDVHELFDHYI